MTTEMSRTIDGKRGSARTSVSAIGARRSMASRSSSATKISSPPGSPPPFGLRRHQQPNRPYRRLSDGNGRGAAGHEAGRCRVGEPQRQGERLAEPLDDATASKKSAGRMPPPVLHHAGARQREGHPVAFAFGGGEAGAHLEQPHVADLVPAVVRHAVDEPRQQRRPEDGELLGERVGERHRRLARAGDGAASAASMKVQLTASEKPAAARTWRTSAFLAIRGSGRGATARSGGKCDGTLS